MNFDSKTEWNREVGNRWEDTLEASGPWKLSSFSHEEICGSHEYLCSKGEGTNETSGSSSDGTLDGNAGGVR